MASLPSHAAEQTGRLSQPKGPSFKWLSAILLALLVRPRRPLATAACPSSHNYLLDRFPRATPVPQNEPPSTLCILGYLNRHPLSAVGGASENSRGTCMRRDSLESVKCMIRTSHRSGHSRHASEAQPSLSLDAVRVHRRPAALLSCTHAQMLVSANLLKRVHRLPTRHTVARAMEANLHKVVDKSMLETIIASNPGAAMSGGRGTWPTAGTLVPLNEILPNGEDLVGDARWHRADDDVGDDIDSLPPNELAKKMTGRRGQPKGQPKGPGGGPDKPAPEQPQGKQWGVKDSAAAAKRVVGSQAGSAVGFAKPPPPPRGTAVGKAITAPVKELLHQHGAANTDTTYTLVIVIGCAPSNFARRGALRATWLQWAIEAPDVLHLFFTENIVEGGRGYTEEAAAQIQQEHDEIGVSLHPQPVPLAYPRLPVSPSPPTFYCPSTLIVHIQRRKG